MVNWDLTPYIYSMSVVCVCCACFCVQLWDLEAIERGIDSGQTQMSPQVYTNWGGHWLLRSGRAIA